jgi:hypothetical protein
MLHFTFRREAKWLLVLTLLGPLLAILATIVLPALRDWLAAR